MAVVGFYQIDESTDCRDLDQGRLWHILRRKVSINYSSQSRETSNPRAPVSSPSKCLDVSKLLLDETHSPMRYCITRTAPVGKSRLMMRLERQEDMHVGSHTCSRRSLACNAAICPHGLNGPPSLAPSKPDCPREGTAMEASIALKSASSPTPSNNLVISPSDASAMRFLVKARACSAISGCGSWR